MDPCTPRSMWLNLLIILSGVVWSMLRKPNAYHSWRMWVSLRGVGKIWIKSRMTPMTDPNRYWHSWQLLFQMRTTPACHVLILPNAFSAVCELSTNLKIHNLSRIWTTLVTGLGQMLVLCHVSFSRTMARRLMRMLSSSPQTTNWNSWLRVYGVWMGHLMLHHPCSVSCMWSRVE